MDCFSREGRLPISRLYFEPRQRKQLFHTIMISSMATYPYNFLATAEDVPLMEPSTSFGLVRAWIRSGKADNMAVFDLVIRELPQKRNFFVFTGLEEAVASILDWKYEEKYIARLEKYGFLDAKTKEFLRTFRFTGSMYALREGAIFFPGETVVKIVAPLAEAALLYNFLVDILCSNTVFATKAARVRIAAGDKGLGSGAIRGHAGEAMLKYMRSAYITGFDLMVAPVFGEKFAVDFPRLLKGTHHHFITSFSTEFDAMLAIAETFPRKEVTLILDTYSVETGLENAIEVAQILQQRNREYGIHSVFIDSGDLEAHARYVRERLDMAGLAEVKIVIASDLNEERLQALVRTGTPFDSCLLATELITSADEPKLDAVYKMAEIIEDGIARSTIKLAPGKKSFPGNKETYRQYDAEGKISSPLRTRRYTGSGCWYRSSSGVSW